MFDLRNFDRNEIKIWYLILYILAIVVFMMTTGRIVHIYIEHDDWDFMLNPAFSQFATPWRKTLTEGRWITFLWSKIAIELSPRFLFVIFITGYSLLCWKVSSIVAKNILFRLLTALALFSCPIYSSFSTWPATTTPSVWIAYSLLFLVTRANNSYIVYFITSFIMSLVYPPLGLICLIALASKSEGLVKSILFCSSYFLGFVSGVLTIYFLNYIFHGHFGIIPDAWRNYHEIKSIDDIYFNAKKTISIFYFFIKSFYFPILASITGLILGFIFRRKSTIPLLMVGLFCFSLDFALAFYSGMDVTERNFIWPWFYMVICINSALFTDNENINLKSNIVKILHASFLLLVFCIGAKTWLYEATIYSRMSKYMEMVSVNLDSVKGDEVYTCGKPKFVHEFTIKMMVRKLDGVDAIAASEDECSKLSATGINHLNNRYYYVF